MKNVTINLPTMYGDHHVLEVRRLLLETPGVEDVYASSSFQVAEITFDPEKVSEEDLRAKLDAAGYIGEMPFDQESGEAAYLHNGATYYRHTEVFQNTRKTISFRQSVKNTGRPLWPCPGMGVIKVGEE